MADNPGSNMQLQKLIEEIKLALSLLADSDLSQQGVESLQQALQKVEQLSGSIATSQNKFQQELQQVQQERNDFISVVTHELRLPMTSIKGYTDLLRQGVVGEVNEQQLGFLETIRNNVDRMSALLSDLSDISRIDTGRMKLEITAVDITQPLDAALQSLEPVWQKKKQSVISELPGDLKPVAADANRLAQVITKLLRNAIMYTPDGGEITLRAVPEDKALRFEIADNGVGIKSEDQARLFSPFFRSDNAYVRDQPGWGTSLYVTLKLVQIMGGSIGMYGEPEAGSVFWFSLPHHTGS